MPQAKVFENDYHNFRLFGSLLLVMLGLIVLAGVKIVNKFALPAVLIVGFWLISFTIISSTGRCLGDRLHLLHLYWNLYEVRRHGQPPVSFLP
jgi:hypothetical protein